MNTVKTILEVQSEIESALQHLSGLSTQLPEVLRPLVRLAPPKGTNAHVSLRHAATDRQIKRSAPADNWSPNSGLVSISYDASEAQKTEDVKSQATETAHPDQLPQQPREEGPIRDLLLTLASAETDPQLGFVSLKWFRDTYLPQRGFAWATTPESRQRVLKDAIDRNWILTSRVPNPKNPQYPVTAIRVNRPLAEVREILNQESGQGSEFDPITIPGECLSDTVVRERR